MKNQVSETGTISMCYELSYQRVVFKVAWLRYQFETMAIDTFSAFLASRPKQGLWNPLQFNVHHFFVLSCHRIILRKHSSLIDLCELSGHHTSKTEDEV